MIYIQCLQNMDCSNVLKLIVRDQANQNIVLYNMRVMKFFRRVFIRYRQFVIMHPEAERIWDISYWRKQLMQHMMLIGQNLSKQYIILFLANMNERNLFRQKAKTFEFVHNCLNAGLGCRIRMNPTRRNKCK